MTEGRANTTLEPGATLDRYVLVRRLGEGGQGQVYLARDRLDGALRALKLVEPRFGGTVDLERARREARTLARLRHPSLCRCYGLFEDLETHVVGYSMDYAAGIDAEAALANPRFSPALRTMVLHHIAEVLGYLHGEGVVHRDLKPENVVLDERFWRAPEVPDHVRLVDFGIALGSLPGGRLTADGHVLGTPPYVAPELIEPGAWGPESASAADVFAFGVLAWRLLAGRHPTALPADALLGAYVSAYRQAARGGSWPPRLPDVACPGAPQLAAAVRRCLALHPADRPGDGWEVVALLGSPPAWVAREETAPRSVAMSRSTAPPPVAPTVSRTEPETEAASEQRTVPASLPPMSPPPATRTSPDPTLHARPSWPSSAPLTPPAVARSARAAGSGEGLVGSAVRWGVTMLAIALAAGGVTVAANRCAAPDDDEVVTLQLPRSEHTATPTSTPRPTATLMPEPAPSTELLPLPPLPPSPPLAEFRREPAYELHYRARLGAGDHQSYVDPIPVLIEDRLLQRDHPEDEPPTLAYADAERRLARVHADAYRHYHAIVRGEPLVEVRIGADGGTVTILQGDCRDYYAHLRWMDTSGNAVQKARGLALRGSVPRDNRACGLAVAELLRQSWYR